MVWDLLSARLRASRIRRVMQLAHSAFDLFAQRRAHVRRVVNDGRNGGARHARPFRDVVNVGHGRVSVDDLVAIIVYHKRFCLTTAKTLLYVKTTMRLAKRLAKRIDHTS